MGRPRRPVLRRGGHVAGVGRGAARRCVVVVETRQLYEASVAAEHGITGEKFQSKREAKMFVALLEKQAAGDIRNLRRGLHEPVPLQTRNRDNLMVTVTRYVPDFLFDEEYEPGKWRPVVMDVKGWREDIYKLKKKWLEAQYGITIREA